MTTEETARNTKPARDVWAVISLFRPDAGAVAVCEAAIAQVDHVVVVDDGSGDGFDDIHDALESRGALVVVKETNEGIAAALNAGSNVAIEAGAKYLLFLDQDSAPSPGFVDALFGGVASAESDSVPWGFMVPEHFATLSQGGKKFRDGLLESHNAIQSGMLMSVATYRTAGPFVEQYFIDLVDTEYELRLRRLGFVPLAVAGLHLGHQLGANYVRRTWRSYYRYLTLQPTVTLSTPFRYYYRSRNRVFLNARYLWRQPVARLKETVADVIHFCDVVALARPRRSMFALIMRGTLDGLRGKGGKMPASMQERASRIAWNADRTADND